MSQQQQKKEIERRGRGRRGEGKREERMEGRMEKGIGGINLNQTRFLPT